MFNCKKSGWLTRECRVTNTEMCEISRQISVCYQDGTGSDARLVINGIISKISYYCLDHRRGLGISQFGKYQYNVLALRSMGSDWGKMIETEIDFVQD